MKKISKFLCLLVAIVFAFSIALTGCGKTEDTASKESTNTAASNSTVAEAATATEELKPVELIWYQFINKKQKDEELVIEELNKYLKGKINATVKATFLEPQDYQTKMPIIINSGQPYDVCFTTSWLNYGSFVANGAFLPVEELADKYAKDAKSAMPQALWDSIKIKGKVYAVPGYKETGHQFGLIYNKDMADQAGYDMSSIKKFTDLEGLFKAVKEKLPGVIPYNGGSMYEMAFPNEHITGDWSLPGVLNVPGMECFARTDDKIFNQYETPEFLTFTTMINNWWKAGYIPKDTLKYGQSGQTDPDYKAKKLFSSAVWYAPGCEKNMEQSLGIKIGYAPLYAPIMETADLSGGANYAISKDSQNPERAMMFINLLFTDKTVGNYVRHGIENKHYVLKGDQVDIAGVAGIDPMNHPYDNGAGWFFGNIFNQNWPASFPAGIDKMYLDYNAGAKATSGLGFNFDNKPVQTEVAAINNTLKEFADPLKTGMIDPKVYVPKLNEKLKANGVDKLIAEVQKQYDEWKATK